jgi:hypothetical protein
MAVKMDARSVVLKVAQTAVPTADCWAVSKAVSKAVLKAACWAVSKAA